MPKVSEFSLWLRTVCKPPRQSKTAEGYLQQIEENTLGLLEPASAMSKTKEEIMRPVDYAAATKDVFQKIFGS